MASSAGAMQIDDDTFAAVAQAALARALKLSSAAAAMLDIERASGQPTVAVVNDHLDGDAIEVYLAGGYRYDRLRAHARQTRTPALSAVLLGRREACQHAAYLGCRDAACQHIAVAPLTGLGRVLGMVRVAAEHPLPAGTGDRLAALCADVSVRLAHLGFHDHGGLGPLRLTARQREVARLLSRGLTNAGIADALGVTEHAVKRHLKVMMADLDLANRAELALVVGRALSGPDGIADDRVGPGFRLFRERPGDVRSLADAG